MTPHQERWSPVTTLNGHEHLEHNSRRCNDECERAAAGDSGKFIIRWRTGNPELMESKSNLKFASPAPVAATGKCQIFHVICERMCLCSPIVVFDSSKQFPVLVSVSIIQIDVWFVPAIQATASQQHQRNHFCVKNLFIENRFNVIYYFLIYFWTRKKYPDSPVPLTCGIERKAVVPAIFHDISAAPSDWQFFLLDSLE